MKIQMLVLFFGMVVVVEMTGCCVIAIETSETADICLYRCGARSVDRMLCVYRRGE